MSGRRRTGSHVLHVLVLIMVISLSTGLVILVHTFGSPVAVPAIPSNVGDFIVSRWSFALISLMIAALIAAVALKDPLAD